MSITPTWERALARYGDRIYRLALLRDPAPARAARAVTHAFKAADWSGAGLDEATEARIVAALPAPGRWPPARRLSLAPLPAGFWRLPAAARLALGLRLMRGYTAAAIAPALRQTPDEVRRLLLDATARLAGDDPAVMPAACRESRLARLDESAAERRHLITCADCRAAVTAYGASEQALAAQMERATAAYYLPRAAADAITRRLADAPERPPHGRLSPRLLQGLLAVAVVAAVVLLVAPRPEARTLAPPTTAPRDLLQTALEQYGVDPAGDDVVHRRYQFELRDPRITLDAETWTDGRNPARHRMQLAVAANVQEWQAGDGETTLRYVSNGALQFCGRPYPGAAAQVGPIAAWRMSAERQNELRAARWQFGAWATGRRYLQQALEATTLRSLGRTRDGDVEVITLAAEDATIDGTLMLELDAARGDLREVREIQVGNGATRAFVPWRLLDEERIDYETALRSGALTAFPGAARPVVEEREAPIVDPACPTWDTAQAYSLATALRRGTPPVVGLGETPAEIETIYLSGPPHGGVDSGGQTMPGYLSLVLVGDGKRLTMRPSSSGAASLASAPVPAEELRQAGGWLVRFRPAGAGRLRGEARPAPDTPYPQPPAFWFFAEGWTEQQLLEILPSARLLTIEDWYRDRGLVYEPAPSPVAAAHRP